MSKELNIPDDLLAKLTAAGIHSVEELVKMPAPVLESLGLEYHDAVVLRDALAGLGYRVLLIPYAVPGEPDPKTLEELGRIVMNYHLRAQITASAFADRVIEWIDNHGGGKK